ncbi:MAG: DUF2975 domain-containing protein [Hyphomicrobium sp.]
MPLKFPAVGPLGRLSALMCVVVAVGGALAEIALAWVWLTPSWVEAYVVPHLALRGVPVAFDLTTRLMAFAASMIPMAVLLYLLHQAYALFDAFRIGNVFTTEAPIRLRRIGSCIVALAILRPLTATLLGLILTWSNPPGQRILALSLGIDDYMIAALGGLVLAIGHVMAEAARIADDNRQIV